MSRHQAGVRGTVLLSLLLAAASSSWALGQTTQPAAPSPPANPPPPSWQDVLARLADQLAGQDHNALRASLDQNPLIRNFSSDGPTTIERLLSATSQAKLLGTHAYPKVPVTLASDLAEDFKNAGDAVPEQVQKDMAPPAGAAEKRANDTAAQWIVQALQPRKDQPVGVIVFWPTERRGLSDTPVRRAVFVLLKAQSIGGAYVVQQITFGDPLETPR